jgi:hypothetical protein
MEDIEDLLITFILIAIVIFIFVVTLRCIFNQHDTYTHKVYEVIELEQEKEKESKLEPDEFYSTHY